MGMFDDMMSSGRGPGVIGTLMALLVIVGFGSLYFFVFDEGMRGGDRSIESVIRDNGKEIDNLTTQIESRKKSLEGAPDLIRIASEAEEIARKTRMEKGTVKGRIETVATAKNDLAAKDKEFEAYKQTYRQQLRAQGKGMAYPELVVGTETYKEATITAVDATGITFRYAGGSKRIDFEKLPPAIREHFQYDPAAAVLTREEEATTLKEHIDETEEARIERERLAKIEEEKRRAAARQKATEEYATQSARLSEIKQTIINTERQMNRDRQSKSLFNRAGYENTLRDLKARRDSVQLLVNSAKKALEETSQ